MRRRRRTPWVKIDFYEIAEEGIRQKPLDRLWIRPKNPVVNSVTVTIMQDISIAQHQPRVEISRDHVHAQTSSRLSKSCKQDTQTSSRLSKSCKQDTQTSPGSVNLANRIHKPLQSSRLSESCKQDTLHI